ncbi:HVO_A0556 family zinc finger protein [Halosolutus amylolyticus]|uniref:HVO_A0556 family zinc finger protein n=1 Tax=Halosolutus amylolyticus TaxID=2932267 RepID=A0ABD5PS54_9EURY|nr:HVO_A0556 family zinc finger protein [Halosolutus amylolyticus]
MESVSDHAVDAAEPSPLDQLEDTACTFCDSGLLVRNQYKGNDAVVCNNCETPAMQVWDVK